MKFPLGVLFATGAAARSPHTAAGWNHLQPVHHKQVNARHHQVSQHQVREVEDEEQSFLEETRATKKRQMSHQQKKTSKSGRRTKRQPTTNEIVYEPPQPSTEDLISRLSDGQENLKDQVEALAKEIKEVALSRERAGNERTEAITWIGMMNGCMIAVVAMVMIYVLYYKAVPTRNSTIGMPSDPRTTMTLDVNALKNQKSPSVGSSVSSPGNDRYTNNEGIHIPNGIWKEPPEGDMMDNFFETEYHPDPKMNPMSQMAQGKDNLNIRDKSQVQ